MQRSSYAQMQRGVQATPTIITYSIATLTNMAEVHIIGNISGGSDFPSANLFCKWNLKIGSAWKVLEGVIDGQTQVDHPKV